jgi:A/G-specific adenine glycosylase
MNFNKVITSWYSENQRNLPWRETKDPYLIWISEVILQQTRVAQGMPYYTAFTQQFPTVSLLAQAQEQDVLRLWQGLGYYSRARNLHATAKHISNEMGGIFPSTYADLLKLKGIGSYTAAAIASFAYDEPVPVVDGNVFRVLSRIFGVEDDISLPRTKKIFWELAFSLIENNAALFNQAIMEFGALQCVPKNPDCKTCVFNHKCYALQQNAISKFPIKTKKIKIKKRYFNYLVFLDASNQTLIQKRTHSDIWKNLYEFPLVETEFEVTFENHATFLKLPNSKFVSKPIKMLHKLTHQQLYISFWVIKVDKLPEKGVKLSEIATYPFPVVIFNFIQTDLL